MAKSLLSDFNPKSIFGDYFPGGRGWVSAYVHAKGVFLAKSLLSDFDPKSIFGDYFPGGRGWVSAYLAFLWQNHCFQISIQNPYLGVFSRG